MQLKWPMRWDLFSLFPAYAGVILEYMTADTKVNAFPRIRGGDPVSQVIQTSESGFSPHTRG